MSSQRLIRRYSAYFRGWATAFGAHEKTVDADRGLVWLFGDRQLGLILTPQVKHLLYPRFLGRHRGEAPRLRLTSDRLEIGDLALPLGTGEAALFQRILLLLEAPADLHLFQTYHLIYPSGTRILTLSQRQPLALVYREIAPLVVEFP